MDQTSVKAGEKVYATPVAGSGYVLTKVLLNGSSESLQLESDGKRYSFVMPDREVEITAQFEKALEHFVENELAPIQKETTQ